MSADLLEQLKMQVEDVEAVLSEHRLGISGYCRCSLTLSLSPDEHRAHVAGRLTTLKPHGREQ